MTTTEGLDERGMERMGSAERHERQADWEDAIVAENANLRELCADLYAEMLAYSKAPTYNASIWATRLRELGIEVPEQ